MCCYCRYEELKPNPAGEHMAVLMADKETPEPIWEPNWKSFLSWFIFGLIILGIGFSSTRC